MKIYQVDVFTSQPFQGNPAGVCLLEQEGDPVWMQQVAGEMNLSETAFLVRQPDGDYHLRWFTPAAEVKLCGHATLASAHTLYQLGLLPPEAEAYFQTLSGLLTARKQGDWIALNFPTQAANPATIPLGLLEALGAPSPVFAGKNVSDFLLEFDSEDVVRDLKPDFGRIGRMQGVRGIIATARSADPQVDFISRFFAPAVGVNEDPVTGSAHTALTPYWSAKLGKTELVAYQASARGGVLRLRDLGERVEIAGQAVTVLSADLLV